MAPYATALAALVDASLAARTSASRRARAWGSLGYYEAVDRRWGRLAPLATAAGGGIVVRAYLAHHQGMTLGALAHVLRDAAMVRRFHSDGRVQATELLLQERVPDRVVVQEPRPAEESRVATPQGPMMARRFRTPHTAHPHAHFLSNGAYTVIVTNAGGGASLWRGNAVTRLREDETRDPGGIFLYLRDVRSGAVWSTAHHPTRQELDGYVASFLPEKASFHGEAHGIETLLEIAVSPEDDVEVRRVTLTNRGARPREIELTSYAELVLGLPADDLAHPAFGKLFVTTSYLPESYALVAHRRPRRSSDPSLYGVHVLSVEGRMQGAVEWESDRKRFLGRGRDVDDPIALDGRPLSGSTGAVLDPIVSLRHRVRIRAGAAARLVRDWCRDRPRRGPRSRAEVPRPRGARARLRARAHARADDAAPPRHLERGRAAVREARLARAVRGLVAARAARAAHAQPARPGGALGSRHLGRSAAARGARGRGGRPAARAAGAAGAGLLAPQGPERGRGGAQRAPRELPRRDARAARHADRERPLGRLQGQAGRRLPAARREPRPPPSACCCKRRRAPC